MNNHNEAAKERAAKTLAFIKAHPHLSHKELAEVLQLKPATVSQYITNSKAKHEKHERPAKRGYATWDCHKERRPLSDNFNGMF